MATTMTPTEQLQAARDQFVPRGLASAMPGFAAEAHGATVTDVEGRSFIDFAAGISVMNVGHDHPRVRAAILEQVARLVHPAAQVMMPEVYVRLAQRLCEVTPGDHAKKAMIVNTGAEAVENAAKIARSFTGRPALVSFHNAFHGRTLLGLSLTGKAAPYKQDFGPFAPEVYQVPFPYPYRTPGNATDVALAGLDALFHAAVSPDRVAAVIVEPIQGEGGFVVPPADFLPRLAEVCREHGILLIADEVQSGFGRAGRMFAIEGSGVDADIVTMAKSLGGGMPIGAVVGRAEVMDAPTAGGLGGTFAGNAVACAAALAVLDVMAEEDLPARALRVGATVRARMEAWQERFPAIGEVRGAGAMMAIELVRDRATREPDPALTAEVLHLCHEGGLIVLKAGLHDNVVRLLMPLTIADAELEEGLLILEGALASTNHNREVTK
ncbi:MAG: 4-aminobutyrate aminotransferase / (S)-3-amino-2-methylpropionate transaminase / 5-aminovalerate [Chloroflexota bacterium]|jgi:4-aminobutyrate aminotransferase/(S)-3-amino-2-methylpropionate transaminase|nr:4-aminobutyrate aminotransferase / (S)-3-amino-2-methylpropionate transaminase / 5-aminovalerate [Chloroflexota bacterium]